MLVLCILGHRTAFSDGAPVIVKTSWSLASVIKIWLPKVNQGTMTSG
jgi:hypothetical protein